MTDDKPGRKDELVDSWTPGRGYADAWPVRHPGGWRSTAAEVAVGHQNSVPPLPHG
jgi:hypothetical protein